MPISCPMTNIKLPVIVGAIVVAILVANAYFGESLKDLVRGGTPSPAPIELSDYNMPEREADRLDVLILGIRGNDDPNAKNAGALLTDSIQIFSYDQKTSKASVISLPRDLYVVVNDGKKDKVNTVYEYGVYHSADSLQFARERFSRITGVYIDKVVVFDFFSFKEVVDALGGVDVTLDKPFKETQQWGYIFSLPAGKNHLSGQSALYYARSRYSTDDFDRSRRQQQIMFAIKDKLLALNFFADPVKTFSVLNLIRNNLKTDIGIWDMKQYIDLAQTLNFATINNHVISTANLVEEGTGPDNAYILVPKGNTLEPIKQLFQTVLTTNP